MGSGGLKARLRIGLAVLVWVALFGASLLAHAKNSANPLIFNDDVRQQVWPFFRYSDGLFQGDYIADYYLNAFLPAGYRTLFAGLALLVDPVTTSKVVPYLCLAVTVVACALAGYRLQGAASLKGIRVGTARPRSGVGD